MSFNDLSKAEKETIAEIIANDVISQLKNSNNIKQSSQISESNHCTKAEIKKFFEGIKLNEKALLLLFSVDTYKLIGAVDSYYKLKQVLNGILTKNTVIDTTTVRKVFLVSDKQLKIIAERTEKLTNIFTVSFDEWKLIVLSPRFDVSFERLLQIRAITQETTLPFFVVENIVCKTSKEEFQESLKRITLVSERYGTQWSDFAYELTNRDFYVIERRVSIVISKKIPILSELYMKELIYMCSCFSEQECIEKVRKVYEFLNNHPGFLDWLKCHATISNKANHSMLFVLLTEEIDRLDKLCRDYRRYLSQHEIEEYNHKKTHAQHEKEKASRKGVYNPIKIGLFCTGNCSSCNREKCTEEY